MTERTFRDLVSPRIIVLEEGKNENIYIVNDNKYSPTELYDYLNSLNLENFEFGFLIVFTPKYPRGSNNPCFKVLKKFCINNDIDLLTKIILNVSVGSRIFWEVRSSKSKYK